MERKISFAPGQYYHLYNRGVNMAKTFLDAHDYWRFFFLMYLCNNSEKVHVENILRNERGESLLKICELVFAYDRGEQLVDIGAFCLMPNHFHLLVREKEENGISQFMLKLGTAYSMYVNKRHARSGPLFCKPFRAEHVHNDNYLKYLYAYIHLNPVKLIDPKWKETGILNLKRAKEYLDSYNYSSYREYTKEGTILGNLLNTNAFPNYFERNADFDSYIHDWLTYRTDIEL